MPRKGNLMIVITFTSHTRPNMRTTWLTNTPCVYSCLYCCLAVKDLAVCTICSKICTLRWTACLCAIRGVQDLLIPSYAINSVPISRFSCFEAVGSRMGMPAHIWVRDSPNSTATAPLLYPGPSKSTFIPTVVYTVRYMFGGLRYTLRPQPCAAQ